MKFENCNFTCAIQFTTQMSCITELFFKRRFIKVREGLAGQSLLETTVSSLCFVSSSIFSKQDVNCLGLSGIFY